MNLLDRFKTLDGREFMLIINFDTSVQILRNGEPYYKDIPMSKAFEYMKELRRQYGAN